MCSVLGNMVHGMKLTKVMVPTLDKIYVLADDRIILVAYRECSRRSKLGIWHVSVCLCVCVCVCACVSLEKFLDT